jgi:hypothetical protein
MTSASQRFNTALNNSARAKQERRKEGARAGLFASKLFAPTPAPDPCAPNRPTAINSNEKCKKVSSFFLMGSLQDRPVSLLRLRDAQGKIPGKPAS